MKENKIRTLTPEQQKEVFEKLPEVCYSTNKVTNEIIIIKRGEIGYYPTNWGPAKPTKDKKASEVVEEWCNLLNERLEVTKAQRKAMENGSMWGWDALGSDPDYYINLNK